MWKRLSVRVPKLAITTIVPNEPLYEMSEGCNAGIYVSKIGTRSPFRTPHAASRVWRREYCCPGV